jgi:hypothetical protein
MANCERIGRWWRGCNWEPQYDYRGPKASEKNTTWNYTGPMGDLHLGDFLVETETYVGALCLTCGAFRDKEGRVHGSASKQG